METTKRKYTKKELEKIKRISIRLIASRGWTRDMVGRKFQLTRQRVSQIVGPVKRLSAEAQ